MMSFDNGCVGWLEEIERLESICSALIALRCGNDLAISRLDMEEPLTFSGAGSGLKETITEDWILHRDNIAQDS